MRLLDEEDPEARRSVAAALGAYGEELPGALAALPAEPGRAARRRIQDLLRPYARRRLRERWRGVRDGADGPGRLERGLGWIAEFHSWLEYPGGPAPRLDALAERARAAGRAGRPEDLVRFLFTEAGLTGAQVEYPAPRHSDLSHVLEAGRGLPIALAAVLILVGARLGLDVRGIGSPAHFLALIRVDGAPVLVDGFHGGRLLDADEVYRLNPGHPEAFEALLNMEVDAAAMLARACANLERGWARAGTAEDARLFGELQDEAAGAG